MLDASVSVLESPLREVENLTRVFKERDKFYKEEEKFYSDYVKKLNYEKTSYYIFNVNIFFC